VADRVASGGALDETARENARLERRLKRLEALLEQVEKIRDANGKLMDRLMSDLDRERTRSRELLLNTLPATIVERLDAGETRIADGHERVVVLLSDLVGFTETAARMTPIELVDGLNALVTRFDEACARHGVEKIKTIGDAYMAVAGLDSQAGDSSDEPVVAAAELALDMFEALAESGSEWRMRIGLHAGPVVAGVIGSRKFAYDVWGDTVNVAARLETTSEPGRIQVSQPIAQVLAATGGFELVERGEVELKGKGLLPTWFLVGRRQSVGP
jgi:adenylate cyclase